MSFPEYVAVYAEGAKSVDITPKTRFTWDPSDRSLSVEARATPELLAELAASGSLDGVAKISIGEWAKAMTALPALPEGVTASLRELEIDSAKLTQWDGVYALDGLVALTIDAKVKQLPAGISGLASLERLVIRAKLGELPEDLTGLPKLEHLKIVNAPLPALPEELGTLPLEQLELSGTKKLKALPESLGQCATLRVLRTDGVPLKQLPDGVYTLPKLERLEILQSKISKLGTRIDWPELRILDLQGVYKKWPKEVSIPKLEEATLGEKFTELPELFTPSLQRLWVNAPLAAVDPRFAQLRNAARVGLPSLGVKLSCTETAYAALSDAEREAFGSRLQAS